MGDITRYGYIRSTHDKHNSYKFDDIDEGLQLCDWAAGAFPPVDFVPGIVHMLDDKPVCLKDLVKRTLDYNQHWDGGFNVLDIPRLLLAGIEIGAISVVRIEGKVSGGEKMKNETESILLAGWYVKRALDQRPDLEVQLAALVRDLWAAAALVVGVTIEELESMVVHK